MTRLVRTYAATPVDLEVRSDQRTVCGIAVPFGTATEINEGRYSYKEVVQRGAFTRTITERGPQRVKALVNHNQLAAPIGRAETLREDALGLYCELRISKTVAGDETLELVRDGALDAFSIGFVPIQTERRGDDTIVRTEVSLREVSIVAFPAFPDARITAVRAEFPPVLLDLARRRQDAAAVSLWSYLR
jgi:HK97 family phage prohead protease